VQLDLAKVVKDGCKEEGLVGLTFNTIGVRYLPYIPIFFVVVTQFSDAITMGTDGV